MTINLSVRPFMLLGMDDIFNDGLGYKFVRSAGSPNRKASGCDRKITGEKRPDMLIQSQKPLLRNDSFTSLR